MARKAKEILIARGYTEQDLAGMATLLSDPKFCAAIEAEAAEADEHKSQAEKLKTDLAADAEWYRNTAVPQLTRALQDAVTAKSELAKSQAQLKAMQDYGLARVAEGQGVEPDPTKSAALPNPANPNPAEPDPRYVTNDTFSQTVSQYIPATATMQDLSDEYRELYGSRIPGGMAAVHKEFLDARDSNRYRGGFREYVESKFKFAEKRSEIASAEKQKHEEAIRLEERNKVLSEMGNPMTTPMRVSRNPFTNRAATQSGSGNGAGAAAGSGTPAHPWAKTANERSSARVSKFAAKLAG